MCVCCYMHLFGGNILLFLFVLERHKGHSGQWAWRGVD